MASVTSSETEVAEIIRARGRTKQYPYPCYVNAASFISMKLVGAANYGVWQEQMMCLVESHDMIGFINGTLQNPMENGDGEDFRYADWKRSDTLVKGWIFGSLSEYVMSTVVGLLTANDVWNKLKSDYTPPPAAEFTTTSTTSNGGINLITALETTANSSSFIEKDIADYLPLYRAITRNDWEKAREIFDLDKDALTVPLSTGGARAIHIAMDKAETIELVENLLKEMSPESLPGLVISNMRTPLHYAASVDNIMAAKMLVEKNPCLLFILDTACLPIHRSIISSHRRTFLYLLDACKQHILISQQPGYHSPFEGKLGVMLLAFSIDSGFLDAALELIKEYPRLAVSTSSHDNLSSVPLVCIARRWDSYHSGTRYNFYQTLVNAYMPIEKHRLCDTNKIKDIENQETYKANFMTIKTCFYSVVERIYVAIWKVTLLQVSNIKHLQEEKVKHQEALLLLKSICEEVAKLNTLSDMSGHYDRALRNATNNDTPEVVEEIIKYFPETLFTTFDDYNLTQIAIKNRCEKVYNFLVCNMSFDIYWHQHLIDKDRNNSLHLAGRLAPLHKLDRVSGAALQMQRELQWFEEVGNYMKPMYKDWVNIRNETPIMVFRREHRQLRIDGEEWMKKTADSYTIVAALIITIVFAAAITVPGGNDGNTGKAVYETQTSFIVFAVSDAISLFSSTTSLLLFLSILTARYREEDFLYKLPKRLILGLATLFLSVSSMMVAFSATLYLMFGQGKAWILIPIATLTCLPIASFVTLQLPLLVDLISSTYGHGIFAKQSDRKMKQV